MNLLDIVLLLPAAGFVAMLLMPRANAQATRVAALVISLAVFALSLGLIAPVLERGRRHRVPHRHPVDRDRRRSASTWAWTGSASGS